MRAARAIRITRSPLPDTPDVAKVLFGENGVAAGLSAGKTVVDMSSISPIETKSFAEKIGSRGCAYLDAPVSGGEVGAKNASLTIMVGGEEGSFEKVRPLFELMGKNVTLVGPNGAGQSTKVANQIIVALTIGAVAEGLLFASKAGADPAKVRQALTGGLATSRILELHGERMIKRTFDPGFRVALHQKDLDLALDGARTLGLALPATAVAQQLFSVCVANGGSGWDHSALVRALEIMSDHEVAYRPLATREINYAAVDAMNASKSREVGPALALNVEDPRFKGKLDGHTHMGMPGSTALREFDFFLDWADENIKNPTVKKSCQFKGEGGGQDQD